MSAVPTADRWTRQGAPDSRRGVAREGWRTELPLFLVAYAAYVLARWLFVGDLAEARGNANWIYGLEQSAHIAVEGSVQRACDSAAASWLLSNIYLAAQLVVVPCTLIWLYRRTPGVYRELRNTFLATWLIAVPVFALFPVAPPRLAGIGLVDTVSRQAAVGLTGHSTMFYNPLAAVPSLHVGFAAAVGLALARALPSRWARAIALLWAPLVALAVVATGNHYVFDIAAGLAVTGLGFVVGRLPARLTRARTVSRPAGGYTPGIAIWKKWDVCDEPHR
jgi:membrane-associated phospholipid phosphatase